MVTSEEGEGWNHLGKALMPNSAAEASAMLDGFKQIGEQTMQSIFSGASLPELRDALATMYGPQPQELSAASAHLPPVEIVDSTMNLDTGGFSQAYSPSLEPGSLAAPGPGFEGTGSTAAFTETLHSPGLSEGSGFEALSSPSGSLSGNPVQAESYFQAAGPSSPLDSSAWTLEQTSAFPDTGASLNNSGGGLSDVSPGLSDVSPGLSDVSPGLSDVSPGLSDVPAPVLEMQNAVGDLLNKMSDMLASVLQGPMGFLSGLLNFFLTIFSQIVASLTEILSETLRAGAAQAAELWKKHLEMTS